jgi:hypothetical protein
MILMNTYNYIIIFRWGYEVINQLINGGAHPEHDDGIEPTVKQLI